MGLSGAQPGIPFPQASDAQQASRSESIPRSIGGESQSSRGGDDESDRGDSNRNEMEVDEGEPTPVKRPAEASSATLPSIKNLFGIERADALTHVLRSQGLGEGYMGSRGVLTPGSPCSSHTPLAHSPLAEKRAYGHSSSSSFSGLQSGSSSSLGPIRTRHSSTASGSYGRNGIPSTPPRQGFMPHGYAGDDSGRRRVDLRTRQAQSLKGFMMSPPMRRAQLESDGFSDHSLTPQRHRPGSSAGSFHQMMTSAEPPTRASPGHISAVSDPSPMLPPGYAPSIQTSLESAGPDQWGAASTQSESTSPRTSWHSRSSTLDSAESAYKMGMADPMRDQSTSLLAPFREEGSREMLRRSPEHGVFPLTLHGSLRSAQSSGEMSSVRRPRATTLTFTDLPIAPLPEGEDPARRQRLEAASELLRIGQGGLDDRASGLLAGRVYHHKHSLSMQERMPLPMELYTNEPANARGHRPKSHSMSGRGPPLPPGVPYPAPMPQYDRQMPPAPAFDSFHPRRGRGAVEEPMRPGAGFVFPRRPPAEAADAQRSAFQAQMMRGQGLANIPDGIVSGRSPPGGSPRSSATGTILSGQAKYECAWCGKRFSRPSSLKIHHHSHTGEKPFVCTEPGCGRSFSVQSNLRRHQKCHSPGNEQADQRRDSRMAGPSRSDEAELWARQQQQQQQRPPGSWYAPPYGGPLHQDHPPPSRSAYEPGSRSMGSWPREPPYPIQEHQRAPHDEHFTQIRDRRLSESSEDEGEEREPSEIAARDSPKRSSRGGPTSSDDEDRPTRTRSNTTAGLRHNFSSLLNPTPSDPTQAR